MQIGTHVLRNALCVAPMAGVTDAPFRRLCRRFGAGLAVSEMVSSRPDLRASRKSRLRLDHAGEPAPISVQIAGSDPAMMADAARYNVDRGAQIIDINMGCPAKKVCNVMAGSALLEDEPLVARILEAVTAAVDVPVTLKIRTGPSPERRNALRIARIAEDSGIRMLAIHGRTRACRFVGRAEFATIAAVKASVRIPVIANGDIENPRQARRVPGEGHRRTRFVDQWDRLAQKLFGIVHVALPGHALQDGGQRGSCYYRRRRNSRDVSPEEHRTRPSSVQPLRRWARAP